jgi:hypothetical protein
LFVKTPLISQIKNFHFFHFLVIAVLPLYLVHANTTPGIRAEDMDRSNALGGILDNTINISGMVEAIMPRIEEWFVQKPFEPDFSVNINASSVFAILAEYVVESERGINQNSSFVYSSNENETTIEFERSIDFEEGPVIEVNLTLLFRASEHVFRGSEFHSLCDGKGATITLIKAGNGRDAAAYSSGSWGQRGRIPNTRGFLASIVDDPAAIGGYSLHKYAANKNAHVYPSRSWGPTFGSDGSSLFIADRCHKNEYSYSFLGPIHGDDGYGLEGVEPSSLFGVEEFRVLEYEVYQVRHNL